MNKVIVNSVIIDAVEVDELQPTVTLVDVDTVNIAEYPCAKRLKKYGAPKPFPPHFYMKLVVSGGYVQELYFKDEESAITAWNLIAGVKPEPAVSAVPPLKAHYIVRYNGSLQLASDMKNLMILHTADCELVRDYSLPANTHVLEINGFAVAHNISQVVLYLRDIGALAK